MKLPLSWLSKFVTVDADANEIAHRLSMAGLVVESIERRAPTCFGVVVAKVLEVAQHPNADRLHVCEVDAGSAGRFHVVCGAPNVQAGMTAALATVGARLIGAGKQGPAKSLDEALPLDAATIRGVRSEGMLCSERELGFSDEHAGILALPADAPVGANFANYLQLEDTVLDIEITPNRGDCLSILGLAREVAALFGQKLHVPKLKTLRASGKAPFTVEIAAPELCPRYAGLAMTSVSIVPSPIRMRRRLELCGMRPINVVVDATNYVMLERGQPLHAFDLDKIGGRKIVVRRAGTDREFVTLDGVTRNLEANALVIADAERPVALAGVMGGQSSEVGESTTALLLESAYFEAPGVARTSRRLGLRSEASYRFERGVDRAGQADALRRIAELIGGLAGGVEAGDIVDVEARAAAPRKIVLDLGAMNQLLGVEIAPGVARTRLKSIGCEVAPDGRKRFAVTVPTYRPDLNEPTDLAEEVARLSGLEDIPAQLPPRNFSVTPVNSEREFMRGTRDVLFGAGFSETISVAFISPADNARYKGVRAGSQALTVDNPLSAELSEMRASLLPALTGALRFNLNRQATALHVFEIGKTFNLVDGIAKEFRRLGLLSYGAYVVATIGEQPTAANFATLKGVLESYFAALGVGARAAYRPLEPQRAPYLHPGRSADVLLDGEPIGLIGELHPGEAMRIELGGVAAVCELDLEKLIAYGFSPRKSYEPPPRFPSVRRDVALVIERSLPAAMVMGTIREMAPELLENVEVFDVFAGNAIAPGKKSMALALTYRAKDRTLTDEEVNRVHAALVERARTRLGAELRQ
ncbi:MAG TPA: phenylalanine--tRNA ligase subunit beta [Candidatus Binataceae bacterium]|nr:phenylalanine--tRNA ligase subunit beta [Candidatus Binataceae bacterium]